MCVLADARDRRPFVDIRGLGAACSHATALANTLVSRGAEAVHAHVTHGTVPVIDDYEPIVPVSGAPRQSPPFHPAASPARPFRLPLFCAGPPVIRAVFPAAAYAPCDCDGSRCRWCRYVAIRRAFASDPPLRLSDTPHVPPSTLAAPVAASARPAPAPAAAVAAGAAAAAARATVSVIGVVSSSPTVAPPPAPPLPVVSVTAAVAAAVARTSPAPLAAIARSRASPVAGAAGSGAAAAPPLPALDATHVGQSKKAQRRALKKQKTMSAALPER